VRDHQAGNFFAVSGLFLARWHQRMIEDLNAAHDADFAKTYARQQVSAHEKAVDLFSQYSDKGDDAVVKAFAAKTLPVINQHLEEAKKLAQ